MPLHSKSDLLTSLACRRRDEKTFVTLNVKKCELVTLQHSQHKYYQIKNITVGC